jgi:hypothetical protein
MLFSIFIPLFFSWLFKKAAWKRIYLTYLFSGLLIILILLSGFIISMLRAAAAMSAAGAPDTAAFAMGIKEVFGNVLIMLAVTLFFQFIFNKTFGLMKPGA